MQRLNSRVTVNRAAVIIPLKHKLPYLLGSRMAIISKMSGYPIAMHVIGRLQKSINLSDPAALLESLSRLSNLVYTTAEVLSTLESTRVDRYQVNRTEIIAYVTNVVQSFRHYKPSEAEIDLIAHLITASEASLSSWTLVGGGEDDLHSQFLNLYKAVASAPSTESNGDLPVYNPASEQIQKFTDAFKLVRKPEDSDEMFAAKVAARDNEAILYRYSLVRVIDHVYQLLTDQNVWYHFVAPRAKAEVATNLERARTLKVFALYLQSLLTYYQYFNIEMFLASYDLVQEWIAYFPSLLPETISKIEQTIRSHDYLGAKTDVHNLLKSFSASAETEHKALVFPEEFLAPFGLVTSIAEVTAATSKLSVPSNLKEFTALNDAKYLPLTSGVAASMFDVVHDLTESIVKNKQVSHRVEMALWGIVPSISRGSAKEATTGLTALNLSCKIPFVIPHSASYDIMAGVDKGLRNGKVHVDSGAPDYSRAYHEYIRSDRSFSLFTDRQVAQGYPQFALDFIIDYDKAKELQQYMALSWNTLIPSHLASSENRYTPDDFYGSADRTKMLVEHVSKKSYEIAIRELSLPHIREQWATFVSSFALLYYVDGDKRTLKTTLKDKYWTQKTVDTAILVDGMGKPYGTNYDTLASLQGTFDADTQVLPLGYGLYLRFLKAYPTPTIDLKNDGTVMFNQHPVSYFASNSEVTPVTEWVFTDEGLWNFALLPFPQTGYIPQVKFTQKFAFLTTTLYFNMDMYYQPGGPSTAREVIDIPIVVSPWPYEYQQYFLRYTHFGSYAASSSPGAPVEDTVLLADTIKKVENEMEKAVKEGVEQGEKAGTAFKQTAKAAETEVVRANNEITGKTLDSSEEIKI